MMKRRRCGVYALTAELVIVGAVWIGAVGVGLAVFDEDVPLAVVPLPLVLTVPFGAAAALILRRNYVAFEGNSVSVVAAGVAQVFPAGDVSLSVPQPSFVPSPVVLVDARGRRHTLGLVHQGMLWTPLRLRLLVRAAGRAGVSVG